MEAGQQVSGEYYGQKFHGVITEQRALTVRTDGAFERFIDLSAPITVFGTERNSIVVYTKYDGSPSSYTKYSDSLQVATPNNH
jgi:hypothetical protein